MLGRPCSTCAERFAKASLGVGHQVREGAAAAIVATQHLEVKVWLNSSSAPRAATDGCRLRCDAARRCANFEGVRVP